MTKSEEVYAALCKRLEALDLSALSLDLPVAYPEVSFSPPEDGRYLLVSDFVNAPKWVDTEGQKIAQGIFQVAVVWPKNEGLMVLKRVATKVLDHFAATPTLQESGTSVHLGYAWDTSPISDTDQVRVPVSIPWWA